MAGRALPAGMGAARLELMTRCGVTSREAQILEAVGARLSNAEIAEQLYVSVRTVENHVSSLLRKLGAQRRRELAQIWVACGASVAPAGMRLPAPLELLADPATFVGRHDERARLVELWHRAKAGRLLVALLLGEAGIGKSRLTAELALEVQQDGGQVRIGSCHEDVAVPYEPIVEMIEMDVGGLSDQELDDRTRGRWPVLARVVPGLARRLDVGPSPVLAEGWSERDMLLSAIQDYWSNMARGISQLVVVEDLHWSTATTRDAVRHIARTAAAVPMLVVLTSRDVPPDLDESLAMFLSDLAQLPSVEAIALRSLSEVEVADLLHACASDAAIDVDAAARIHAATDGNPLLALEAAGAVAGPSPTTSLLARRYDRLARPELDVLDMAVVVGSEFDAALVAAAAHRDVEETIKALEVAEQCGLIAAVPGRLGRFAFVHSLFRTVRYESIATSRKLRLHQSIAAVLQYGADDEDVLPALAHHACVAAPVGDARAAVDLARRAGHLARRQLALEEAANRFRQAMATLELVPVPDRRLRLELQIDLGRVRLSAGHADGTALLLDALDAARRHNDHDLLGDTTLALSAVGAPLAFAGHTDGRVASALRGALAVMPDEPSSRRARLLAGLSGELIDEDVLGARALARQAIDMARHLDDVTTLAHALVTYRFLINEPALADERGAVAQELIELGRRLDEPTLSIAGLDCLLTLHRETGDLTTVDEIRAQLDQFSAGHASPFTHMTMIAHEATNRYLHGDLNGAENIIEAITTIREQGVVDPFAIYAAHLLAIRSQQGRIVEYLPLIEQVAADMPDYRAYQAVLLGVQARAGNVDAAVDLLDQLAAHDYDMPHNLNWFAGMEAIADGVEILGDQAVAAVVRNRLAPFGGRLCDFAFGVTRPADQALVQLMLTVGDLDEAVATATRAVAASRQRGTPIFLGQELVLLATARYRAGQPTTRLQRLLDEAQQIADATGAHRIEQEMMRYGLTV